MLIAAPERFDCDHRRALAGRVRRGPPARRRQLAGARRRAAAHRRHAVQAGVGAAPRARSARRWWRATSPRTSNAGCRTSRATGSRWSTAGAAASARAAWPGSWARSAFARTQLGGGYKAWRAIVRDELDDAAAALQLPGAVRAHRQRQDAPARGAGRARRADARPRRRWPATAARCSAPCPASRSRRRSASTRCCGKR